MAQAPTKKAATKRRTRMDRDIVRTSIPQEGPNEKRMLKRPTRLTGDYIGASIGNKAGWQTYKLECGDATYRAVTWGIQVNAAIAGVTQLIAGFHYVKENLLDNYIDEVRTVANGTTMQELRQFELTIRNNFHGITFGPCHSGFAFPGDNQYDSRAMTDAFALGTRNLKTLTLELKLKNAFDPSTMQISVMPYVVDKPALARFCNTTDRQSTTFTSIGEHTYNDLPVGDDLKDIWIMADGISRIKLKVDDDLLFDMNRVEYESWLYHNGRDPSALFGNWFLDFHVEGEPRSLAALDRPAERRRDARYQLTVTTTNQNTPVNFLMTNSDIYRKIR